MTRSVDTRVRVGSVELRSPIMTASGTAGYGDELSAYLDLSSLGAVVTKSIAAYEWAGNPAPRVHATPLGMINAVGLQGPGVAAWLDHHLPSLAAHGRHRGVQHLGPVARRLPRGRRRARRRARPRWWRSR